MPNEFKFNPSAVSEAVNKKLVIERLPEWMQNSEQIQMFFDNIIQQWFTPEEQKLVDGYIGQRGSPAASGKVFLEEDTIPRQEYQFSPAYVSRNADNSVRSVQFYPDLVGYLNHYGSLTENQSRLLSGNFYSWTPPINPNKLQNYSSYVWDNENEFGIEPDYIVMERGALNGNTWSLQNYWYTIGQTLSDGTVLTEQLSLTSRFKRAGAPIIEYNKNIELVNYGTRFRGVVDYLADTMKPEDIVQRRVSDDVRVDGYILSAGDRVLFTSIGNAGENNRIYKIEIKQMADGSRVYGVVLDEDEETDQRPSGEPLLGDVVLVRNGNQYANKSFYWNGQFWIETQEKSGINTFPSFKLYDRNGVELNDPLKYPQSTFNGSALFGLKINFNYPEDKIYKKHVELSEYNYYVFENFIQTQRFEYIKTNARTEIQGLYFYKLISDNNGQLVEKLCSDWIRNESETKQFVNQVPTVTKTSMFRIFNTLFDLNNFKDTIENMYAYVIENDTNYRYYKEENANYSTWHEISEEAVQSDVFQRTYDVAMRIDPNNKDEIINIYLDGEQLFDDVNYILDRDGLIQSFHIGDSHVINDNSIIDVKLYSPSKVPDTNLGAYEIPINLQNNPYNEMIDYIHQGDYTLHFRDIIRKNITTGSVSDLNDYELRLEKGLVNNAVGTYIIQNEASLVPLMICTANDNLDIFNSIMFTQNEYFRFKNRFNFKMLSMYKENPDAFLANTASNIVDEILNSINIGKDNTFPYAMVNVGSSATIQQTFIPPTPQFLGILQSYRPQNEVYMYAGRKLGCYNIDHTGSVTKAYKVINGISLMDDVLFELESRIYDSIDNMFKDVDFVPSLNVSTLEPSAYYTSTEYNRDEYNSLLLRGYSNFIASNGIDGTMHDYDSSNWMTWNFTGTMYVVDGKVTNIPARGSWRAIYTDMYGTYRPHTHPWEMFGFSQRPEWFNLEYKPSKVRVGADPSEYVYVYEAYVKNEQGNLVPSGLWDTTDAKGDVSTGTILAGKRKGVYPEFKHFGVQPFELVDTGKVAADGEHIMNIIMKSPVDLGMISGALNHRAEPWKYGDMGETEFTYMNTALFSFDKAMALLRAKPAQFANYFYDTKGSYLQSVENSGVQFLYKDTNKRLNLNSDTLVHTENDTRILGYQTWISESLINQNKNVTKNYGDILRSSYINVGHRIGGFTKEDQLTFSSDGFGLISQENQHIGLVVSSIIKESTHSSVKITWTSDGYVVEGYDLINPRFTVLKPNKIGRRHTINIGNVSVVNYNDYTDQVEYVEYGTLMKSYQDVYTFLCSYGKFLEKSGWIYEDSTENGDILNWNYIAKDYILWSQSKINYGNYISVSPNTASAKFGSTFGSVLSVTEYSGGVWTLLDDNNQGIRPNEIDTTRIGNVFSVRIVDESEKRMALIRLNLHSYEHSIIFDDRTIFGDNIYIAKYGSVHEMLKMYGYITSNWNGRLEGPGFMILEKGTLPNFEKLVNDFTLYFDNITPVDNTDLKNLSRHVIGFQTRDYISEMITNESSQLDFYKGFIKQKGTQQCFEKVLRVSKTYNTENYKALEEWAFKVGTYGNVYGKKHLQFNLINNEFVQEPQLFSFDSTLDKKPSNSDGFVEYYGKQGDDLRWVTRPHGSADFPLRYGRNTSLNIPDIGPVNLNDVDFSTVDFNSVTVARKKFTKTYNKQPLSVWMYRDFDNSWNIYNIVNTNITLLRIEPLSQAEDPSGLYCKLVLSGNSGLVDGQYFYFMDSTDYMPDGLRNENQFFTTVNANEIVVPLTVSNTITFTDDYPVLYKYTPKFTTNEDKNNYINEKYKYPAPESSLFEKPSTYNSQTNITELYMNIYDPINGIIPGSLVSELTYMSTNNPATYNSLEDTTDAWGNQYVGRLWWDTTNAFFLDYTRPVLNADGSVNELETLKYKRDNWGKLLPESSIDIYEWVQSPVSPNEWAKYCEKCAKLNKDPNAWVPSGEAREDDYSIFSEYDDTTKGYKTYYYFWVKNPIYIPKLMNRYKSANDVARGIINPLSLNIPWFSPVSKNAFICSGLQTNITDDKSIITLTYQTSNTEVVKHEQYQLCKEGMDYNFNPNIWNSMFNSLMSFETVNGKNYELLYPKTDLGCGPNKTWFKDVIEARRTFVDSANDIYRTINLITDSVIMNDIFNVKTTEKNPNEIDFKVLRVNNELVISPEQDKFVENDPVFLSSTGTLPEPLTSTDVYFVHFDKDNYIKLMRSPSTSTSAVTITITTQGEGVHSMIKQSDYVESLGTSLDMTKYWSYTDWYAVGYNENTSFIDETSLEAANRKNYQEGDIIRVIGSDNIWTMYIKTFTRGQVLWEAIGRQNSTVKLNNILYHGYKQYNDDGTLTPLEKNIRQALALLKKSFNTVQSRLVFDMVKYAHTEQHVIDWAFKTSYIYVVGLEQSLKQNYLEHDNLINQIVAYFEEVKPYRTKIRSQIEQKTSDEDEVTGISNDLDPNGYVYVNGAWIKTEKDIWDYEYAQFNKTTGRWEKVGSLPNNFTTPHRRFQEANIVLHFDNYKCSPDDDLADVYTYEQMNKKYVSQKADQHTPIQDYMISRFAFNTPLINMDEIERNVGFELNKIYDWFNLNISLSAAVNDGYKRFINDIVATNKFTDDVKSSYNKVTAESETYQEALLYVQYNNVANRARIYNSELTDETISREVGCPFKGKNITDNPNTRLPFGYSANSDYNYGYVSYDQKFFEHYVSMAKAINPTFTDEQINDYLRFEYGIYPWLVDIETNGKNYTDTLYVMTALRNSYNPNNVDHYEICRQLIENIKTLDMYCVVLIPRKFITLYNAKTKEFVDVPMEKGIVEFMEDQFIINGDDLMVTEPVFDDIPLDKTNPLYSDYNEVMDGINNAQFYNDMNAFDNLALESQTKTIMHVGKDVASDVEDPVFYSIFELNPNGYDMAQIRFTVDGYNYDKAGQVPLKNNGKFQIEGFIVLNPYNKTEAMVSIPHYDEALSYMNKNIISRNPIEYIFNITRINTTTGKVTIPNHKLRVGDKVAIFTDEGKDFELQFADRTWKTILPVANIMKNNRPVLFNVSAIDGDVVTIDGLKFNMVIDYRNADLMSPSIKFSLNVVRVTSFSDPEFSVNGNSLYSTQRTYRIDAMDYDIFYDRQVIQPRYEQSLTLEQLDNWYMTNEIVNYGTPDEVDHGYYLPIYGKGVLSELVRTKITENVQIYVYDYDPAVIKPVYNADSNSWSYTGTYTDNVYISSVNSKLTVVYKGSDMSKWLVCVPSSNAQFGILNGVVTGNVHNDDIININGGLSQIINSEYMLSGIHNSVEYYYKPNTSYTKFGLNMGREIEMTPYADQYLTYPENMFKNGYTVDGSIVDKLLKN